MNGKQEREVRRKERGLKLKKFIEDVTALTIARVDESLESFSYRLESTLRTVRNEMERRENVESSASEGNEKSLGGKKRKSRRKVTLSEKSARRECCRIAIETKQVVQRSEENERD